LIICGAGALTYGTGDENCLVSLAGNHDRLIGSGRFVDQPVKIASRLGGCNA